MDTPAERHPAGKGLMESGYVVSVVRSAADLRMHILGDTYFIGITVPGNPCDVLLCCSARGAEELGAMLNAGLEQLRAERERDR